MKPEPKAVPVRILLIEDNPADTLLVREALADHGVDYELQEATNGEKAIDVIDRIDNGIAQPPDIILLDLNLPRRSGSEVLERIAASGRTAAVPVVVISSSANPEDQHTANKLGAVHYFRKPTDLDGFMALGGVIKRLTQTGSRS
jgi:CheY-like chemotaxis protein